MSDVPVSAPESTAAANDEMDNELSHAQDTLANLKQQLAESQRLATIGTIAAVIAHEFNNLLAPIMGYSQYALKSAESETPDMVMITKALSKAFTASSKAGKICNSMLGLARGESSFGPVSVQTLIDETLLVLARDPKKDGMSLRVQVQPDLIVQGDAVQLEQVLLNLLINARHAMLGKGGSLTIKAAHNENHQVRISVSDTGKGIADESLPKIFEPFFTTKAAKRPGDTQGTGLGLSICKEIIEHHGGQISVESHIGKGTTFTILLPGMVEAPALAA